MADQTVPPMGFTSERVGFVAVVGRVYPKTGGEFYNQHALAGMADVLGEPHTFESDSGLRWMGWFNRSGFRSVYNVMMNTYFFFSFLRCRPKYCFVDFFMFRFLWLFRLTPGFQRLNSVVVVHDLYHVLLPSGWRKCLVIWGQRFFLAGCSRIVTTSKDTANRLISDLSMSDSNICVIPPGIDRVEGADDLASIKEEKRGESIKVLFVGMVKHEKGVIDLVHAMTFLASRGINTELHIAGRTDIEPDYTRQLLQDAGELPVKCHGFLGKKNLYQLYQDCDIFVLPSYYETFGMVLVEAMQMGLPVIAAASGGVPDIVRHQQNGMLYSPGDVATLAEHIRHLSEDADLCFQLAQAGLAHVKTFLDWRDVRNRFKALAGLL